MQIAGRALPSPFVSLTVDRGSGCDGAAAFANSLASARSPLHAPDRVPVAGTAAADGAHRRAHPAKRRGHPVVGGGVIRSSAFATPSGPLAIRRRPEPFSCQKRFGLLDEERSLGAPVRDVEEWAPVIGPGGWHGYTVSTLGRVRRARREVAPNLNALGYASVSIGGRNRFVHHLVLEAFVGGRLPGMTCNHRNGKPSDNRVGNLEWTLIDENLRHGALLRRHKRGHPSMKGRP